MAYYVSSALDANVIARTADRSAPASARRTSIARSRRSTRSSTRLRARRADAEGARRVAPLPDRLDAARARDQRRHREVPADRRVLRPRPRLRRRGCPICCSAVTLDEVNAAARQRRSIPIARRSSSRARTQDDADLQAVFFDVDFTLIYPGPTFRGEGYQAFCARYGMDVDAVEVRGGGRERGAAARQPGRCLRPGDLRRLHEPHHRADGRHGAARRRVRARDLPRVGRLPALRAVRRRAGGAAAAGGRRACASA